MFAVVHVHEEIELPTSGIRTYVSCANIMQLDGLYLVWSVQYHDLVYHVMFQGTKAIMKDVARYLPGIGWTFVFMEYPFLKRDWAHDEAALVESCHNLSDYPVNMLVSEYAYMYRTCYCM